MFPLTNLLLFTAVVSRSFICAYDSPKGHTQLLKTEKDFGRTSLENQALRTCKEEEEEEGKSKEVKVVSIDRSEPKKRHSSYALQR